MNKRIASIALAFVLVFTMVVTAVSTVSAAGGNITVSVVPDKTEVHPGDVVNYKIVIGPVKELNSGGGKLAVPDGLTITSGGPIDGQKEILGADSYQFDYTKMVFDLTGGTFNYSSDVNTDLFEFTAKVAEDAEPGTEYSISFIEEKCDFGDWDLDTFDVTYVEGTIKVVSNEEETTAEGTTAEETTAEDTTTEDTTAEETTVEDTTAEETTEPTEPTTESVDADLEVAATSNYCNSPAAQTVKKDETVTVTFTAPEAMDVASIQWGVNYDKDLLELTEVTTMAPDGMAINKNTESYSAMGNFSNLTAPCSISEGDTVVSLVFTAKGDGETIVDLRVIDLLKKTADSNVPKSVVVDGVIQPDPQEDTTAEETTVEETTVEETTVEETTVEETTVEETTVEETTVEETTVEETTVEETTVEETTVEETTVEETTVEETTVEETTVEETTVEETTVEETTVEETTVEETTVEETTVEESTAPASHDVVIQGTNIDVFGDGTDLDELELTDDGKLVKTVTATEPVEGVQVDSVTVDGVPYVSENGGSLTFNVTEAGDFKLVLDPTTKTFTVVGENIEIVETTVPATAPDASEDATSNQNPASPDSTPSEASNTSNGAVQTGDASMAVIILLVLVASTAGIYFTRKKVK